MNKKIELGNSVLDGGRMITKKDILKIHGEYKRYNTCCNVLPLIRNGVEFFPVGRNSSHYFSLGIDDQGRAYKLVCGEGDVVESFDDNTSGDFGGAASYVEYIREITEIGYIGHY